MMTTSSCVVERRGACALMMTSSSCVVERRGACESAETSCGREEGRWRVPLKKMDCTHRTASLRLDVLPAAGLDLT